MELEVLLLLEEHMPSKSKYVQVPSKVTAWYGTGTSRESHATELLSEVYTSAVV